MTVLKTIILLHLISFTVDLIIGRKLAKKDYFSQLNLEEILLDTEDELQYKPIGCYRDELNDRALPVLYEVKTGFPVTEIKKGCANAAVLNGFVYFGIQFRGECWGSKDGYLRYNMYGSADNCEDNIGGPLSNYVYKIEKAKGYCVYHSILLNYNKTVNGNDPCDTCRCMEDGNVICHHKTCPVVPIKCEKQVTPPGQCCPVCACYHKNTWYNDGDHWVWPVNDAGCEKCNCTNKQAVCVMEACPICSQYEAIKPGQCCRDCVLVTKQPTIRIPPTTEEPVLTFPPWP